VGMFDTRGSYDNSERKASTIQKLIRMNKALNQEEPDRVPISDFFWGSFIERWREDLGLPDDANPYYYYDLDWIVTTPNMDPWIRQFETIKENQNEVVVKTGFGSFMRKKFDCPMPENYAWEVDEFDKLIRAVNTFDAPDDKRRFFEEGDNQIAGVGDGFSRNSPPWLETVKSLRPDFPVYGSMIEVSECLTRLIGQYNSMLWIGLYPDEMGRIINKIGEFYLACAKSQIEAGKGLLDGFVIWGDVAYKNGMFFSPEYWRTYYMPWVKHMVEFAHNNNLPVIYHGCGNMHSIIEDFIDIDVDALNPLEVKASMDCVDLRKKYGHKFGICGNSDIRIWETGNNDMIRKEVLRKLNAAKGGGYIFQSDHSVASNVSGNTYNYIVNLVREYGGYPLNLSEFDEDLREVSV